MNLFRSKSSRLTETEIPLRPSHLTLDPRAVAQAAVDAAKQECSAASDACTRLDEVQRSWPLRKENALRIHFLALKKLALAQEQFERLSAEGN
jgi:hypothetical protein